MKISVLLSLYAKENPQYFDIAMKSIWDDQTRKPDEIVLVEDGPQTEELYGIVEKWKAKLGDMLKVVVLKENQGLAIALNEGAKNCTGDYIARMDTDDISLPQRFEIQENYLKEHSDIAVLGGGMIEFNDEEGDMPARLMPESHDAIKAVICKTSPFVHPSVMIRKDLFDKGYQYDPTCRKCQDIDLWGRLIAVGFKMANVPEVLVKYRKDDLLYDKRRKSAGHEFKVVTRTIYRIYGPLSCKYIYPIVHYIFHALIPAGLQKKIYHKFILPYWRKQP